MRRILMLLTIVVLGGCKLEAPAAPAKCERMGDRCALQAGLQGVCTIDDAARCDHPPCLVCTPQH